MQSVAKTLDKKRGVRGGSACVAEPVHPRGCCLSSAEGNHLTISLGCCFNGIGGKF